DRGAAQLAAVVAGDPPGHKTMRVGPLDGVQDIGAVSAPADGQQRSAGRGEILQLFDEHAVEACVVSPREDIGGIIGEAEDPQTPHLIVAEVFAPQGILPDVGAKMRCIRAASAVAADVHEPFPLPGRKHVPGQSLDLLEVDSPEYFRATIEILSGSKLCAQHDGWSSCRETFQAKSNLSALPGRKQGLAALENGMTSVPREMSCGCF